MGWLDGSGDVLQVQRISNELAHASVLRWQVGKSRMYMSGRTLLAPSGRSSSSRLLFTL